MSELYLAIFLMAVAGGFGLVIPLCVYQFVCYLLEKRLEEVKTKHESNT